MTCNVPVIVTGAQQGIGLGIAEAFGRSSRSVMIADLARQQNAEALRQRWGSDAGVSTWVCGITDGYAERWSPLTPLGRIGTSEDVTKATVAL